tara:strand:+ start:564 stop:1913 length:1350 start_codon:yes stop_codon:yes gene_type:complete
MPKIRLYNPIEVKKREFDSKILFSILFAQKNFSVVLGKKVNLYNYKKLFKPGIFFFKGLGPKNYKPIKELVNLGFVCFSSDEEGLGADYDTEFELRIDKKSLKLIEKFFAWGNFQKEQILKKLNDEFEKFIPSGNARLDILKKPFRKIYDEEAKEIKKKHGNFVLLLTKFTSSNHAAFTVKEGEEYPTKRLWHQREFEFQKDIMINLKKFLNEFNLKHPEIRLVVRPHPIENKENWKEWTKNLKNIHLSIDDYNTNSWILASDFNISSNCTTSMESAFLEKKTINFVTKKDELIEIKAFEKISKEVNTNQELIKVIEDWMIKNNHFECKNIYETEGMEYYVENKLSNFCDNILPYIEKSIHKISKKNDKKNSKINFLILKFIRNIKNIFYGFKASKTERYVGLQKIDSLQIIDVQKRLDHWLRALGIKKDSLFVKEIYPGCFCIEKKEN